MNSLAVLTVALGAFTTDVDGYDFLRRLMIDNCKRLPTIAEVDKVTAGDFNNSTQAMIDYVTDQCHTSENFAEIIGLWVDDFILPSANIANGKDMYLGSITVRVDAEVNATKREYYYPNGIGWTNCGTAYLAANDANMTQAEFDLLFDSVAPYWDMNSTVYVCAGDVNATGDPNTSPQGTVDAAGRRYYSTANTNQTLYTRTLQGAWYNKLVDCRASSYYPCGCGEHLEWCALSAALPSVFTSVASGLSGVQLGYSASVGGRSSRRAQAMDEPRRLVEYIVNNDKPFTDIFTANYSVRTTRLQQWVEALHDIPASQSCLYNGANNATLCDGSLGDSVRPYADSVTPYFTRDGASTWAFPEDSQSVLPAAYREDWDVVQTPAYQAGILTTAEFLTRQPTEPNFASQTFRFWLCEDVSWRGDHTLVEVNASYNSLDGVPFSKLRMTEPANEALWNTQCQGCHLTVNTTAAFRNRWASNGYYYYDGGFATVPSADGIFLLDGVQYAGSDIAALGGFLASSRRVHECIVKRLHRRLTEANPDEAALASLTDDFEATDFDMRALYKAVLETATYQEPR